MSNSDLHRSNTTTCRLCIILSLLLWINHLQF
uniref:Uncharacterized protein n=1 Tax=Anguilla anguilla TaxID=7936 RepID=A0A0E9QZE6_ANGAN